MIKIIGTSHIAAQSVREIEAAVESITPDIIAVELDRGRLAALLSNHKSKLKLSDMRRLGVSGFIFAYIAQKVQKVLGKSVGVNPGAEMLAAVKLAGTKGIKVALIDQRIDVTLKKISKNFRFREKMRVIWDIIRGLIFRQDVIKFDLRTVPADEQIESMLLVVKKRYPSLYYVLIEERNQIMARKLIRIQQKYPQKNILCVVGAGHKKSIEKILSEENLG